MKKLFKKQEEFVYQGVFLICHLDKNDQICDVLRKDGESWKRDSFFLNMVQGNPFIIGFRKLATYIESI